MKYRDESAAFEYRRLRKSTWYRDVHGEEAYETRLEELREAQTPSLLFEEENGTRWTYAGLVPRIASAFCDQVERRHDYPEPTPALVKCKLNHDPRPYQREVFDCLVKARHAAAEVGTGLGKSLVIMMVLQHYGLRSLVMAPSLSIAGQLRDQAVACFGKQHVGTFFGGKKESGKLVTVGVAASLTRISESSEEWSDLSRTQVFVSDESHMTPADTLEKVCHGLVAAAPYRFFFSGTQVRGDGRDLLLEAITGPVVYRMSVKEGVEAGWLARPVFRQVVVGSDSPYRSDNALRMTQRHLLYNPRVLVAAGEVANRMVESGRPVLVLVEEVEQFSRLLPHLRHRVGFAHAPLSRENRGRVPVEYQGSDPARLVEEFNCGELPVLVGTSVIGFGTDVRLAGAIVYLQGGKSEVQVRQAVGRGTRGGLLGGVARPPGARDWAWGDGLKTDCVFWDFAVRQEPGERPHLVTRHAAERRKLYDEVCGPVVVIEG